METLGMEGRKWEIFESSVFLFAQYGYENVSMRTIAEANQIQAASLYHHFQSKETLLETVYNFFYQNITGTRPTLEELVAQIPHVRPHDLLHLAMGNFGDDLQPLMDAIYAVAIAQAHWDHRAYQLIRDNVFHGSRTVLIPLLEQMTVAEKIEPLDTASFSTLFESLAFTTVFHQRTKDAVGKDTWIQCLDLLFSLVKEK